MRRSLARSRVSSPEVVNRWATRPSQMPRSARPQGGACAVGLAERAPQRGRRRRRVRRLEPHRHAPSIRGRRTGLIVRSTCPITGDGVRLNVAPARVVAADPAGLQVSFPAPGAARAQDITGSFCCHVHFLAGQPAGTAWLANHPSGLVLSVRDAFLLGQLVTAALLTGVRFDDGAHAGLPAPQPQGAPVRLLARVLLPAHCGRTRAEVVPAAGRAPVGRARGQANS
jgi:hypothetical protein